MIPRHPPPVQSSTAGTGWLASWLPVDRQTDRQTDREGEGRERMLPCEHGQDLESDEEETPQLAASEHPTDG